MVSSSGINHPSAKSNQGEEEFSFALQNRMHLIQEKYRGYFKLTYEELGLASKQETEPLKAWALEIPLKEEAVADREIWWNRDYSKRVRVALTLNQKFERAIQEALTRGIISHNSADKWDKRFRNKNIGYKEKEKWVEEEMLAYIERWQGIAEKRNAFIKDAEAKKMLIGDPVFSVLWEDEAFLDLHYEKKVSLLASAQAFLNAQKGRNEVLYNTAEKKLQGAVVRGYLSEGKVGSWLQRIFQSGSSAEDIHLFVNGDGSQSLNSLIMNWREARERFDHLQDSIRSRGEDTAARGFTLMSDKAFLSLHYESRLKYLQEAEQRLGEAKNVNDELPIFLKIRHAMDLHDWQDADDLILKARGMGLSVDDLQRLNSMDSFVKQFSGRKESTKGMDGVNEIRKRLDSIVTDMASSHPQLQPMVLRLLKGPNANRSIHQFRWIVYNNKWCRTHGYLDRNIARKGASDENHELTKERKEQGIDIGRNDVVSGDTASTGFIRKEEYAKNKATLLHVDVSDGGANAAVAEKMEKEQNPKMLYWMTYCATEKGEPMSDNWHNDLFFILSELRSLTRSLKKSGFSYGGPGEPLIGLN